MPRPLQADANALARVFGKSDLQTNWQTQNLYLASVAGGATYPILQAGTGAESRYRFVIDAVLLGVGFSGAWITAAADEESSVAIGPSVGSAINIKTASGIFYDTYVFNVAGSQAGQLIQRNPGFMFPPPLVKYVQAGTLVQMYGSRQADITWKYAAKLYWVTVPDYLRAMDLATI